MKMTPICFAIGTSFLFLALASSVKSEDLKSARVTQVVKDVKLLPSNAAARAATTSDDVKRGTAVRTGAESRAELTFTDLTLTRLGANTVFSFDEGTRNLNLESGAILVQVPRNAPAAKVTTAAVTAAITGGTALMESNKGAPIKLLILEGAGKVCPNRDAKKGSKNAPDYGQCQEAHGGEMLIVGLDGIISKPIRFNAEKVPKTSKLIVGFKPLANIDLINDVIQQQQNEGSNSNNNSGPNTGDTGDAISQRTAAIPAPPSFVCPFGH